MKIVNIKGGLGNQMLQYALAYKLKKLQPEEDVYLDLKDFKGYEWHVYELKYVFDVDLPVATKKKLLKVTSPYSCYTLFGRMVRKLFHLFGLLKREYKEKELFVFDLNVFEQNGNRYIDGFWFNESYFSDIRDELLNVFSFKRPLDETNMKVLTEIKASNSVSIHVRRGNYLQFDRYKNICEVDYYKKAIEYMSQHVDHPHFFIFSNDIEWCKKNLSDMLTEFTFVEANVGMNNYIDMQLMSQCKHNIIAHSSFSWWGAWLNTNSEKIVVSPKKWINIDGLKQTPQLEKWVKIS